LDKTFVSVNEMNYADLIQIVELLRQSEQFSSFKLKTPELELEVQRGHAAAEPGPQTPAAAPAAAPAPAPTSTPVPPSPPSPGASALAAPVPAAATAAPAQAPTPPQATDTLRQVTSPMVGTFYAAPEPGAAPFVQVGQTVRAGDVLCIIEVMKLMNTLRAEFDGTVREIAVKDAQPVEYGQVLMQVQPA
jgi:acetyl-CoA carboxylase biotin carboxyl carrier protein